MKALELISKGKTSKAIDVLLAAAQEDKKDSIAKNLLLLKSNLKRSERELMMGLITQEQFQVVTAKTTQYLLDYSKEGELEIAPKEVQGKLKSFVKFPLLIVSGLVVVYALILFYLRRDIFRELVLNQNMDIDMYLLFIPFILLVGGSYVFLKTKNHA